MNRCQICGSEKTNKIFSSPNVHGRQILGKGKEFDIFKCQNCGGVFLGNFQLGSQDLLKYYGKDYYKDSLKYGNKLLQLLIKISEKYSFWRKQRLILSYFSNRKSKVKILDVGCGEGKFLANLNPQKFEAMGVEISKEASRICQKKGLKIINDDFSKADFEEEKFDVITLWHVLEHLNNPVEVIEKIGSLLTRNGILIIATPNTESLGFKLGRENWYHLDTPRHLVLYNMESFKKLCKEVNMKVVATKSEVYDYYTDLYWSLNKSWRKPILYLFYPIVKLLSQETLTYICQRE